ncbi:hypothetical protein B7Z28_01470 [Candidatus Saccharibacteria bacterium 32-45-3]|nr:MAG: hypothetical protein B7Z28_01470 [Candidatus Saccharibacteria bacterium 32-45-3]
MWHNTLVLTFQSTRGGIEMPNQENGPCFGCDPTAFGSRVVAKHPHLGVIVPATRKEGAKFVPVEGTYLLFAPGHITDIYDWSSLRMSLIWAMREAHFSDSDCNISMNLGAEAGQTLDHLHIWLIRRLGGQRSSRKGLSALIHEVDASQA